MNYNKKNFRSRLITFFCIVMVFQFVFTTVVLAETVYVVSEPSVFEDIVGEGTFDDPYLITNEAQFIKISENLSGFYKLMNDITLVNNEVAIGDVDKPFSGTFDGNNYTITSTLEVDTNDPFDAYVPYLSPIFGKVSESGYIKNLNLVYDEAHMLNIVAENTSGEFVGFNEGLIENCSVVANMNMFTKGGTFGGFVGNNTGTINSCSVKGNIFLRSNYYYEYFVGGLAGKNSGTIDNANVEISMNVSIVVRAAVIHVYKGKIKTGGLIGYNSGTIKNSLVDVYAVTYGVGSSNIGGLIGQDWHGEIDNCEINCNLYSNSHSGIAGGLVSESRSTLISKSSSSGIIKGRSSAGGIIGYTYQGNIKYCFSTADTIAKTTGGMAASSQYSLYEDCYSRGDSTAYYTAGGFIGASSGDTVKNCYTTGEVTGNSESGGLIARNGEPFMFTPPATVVNSYYDMDTTGQNDSGKGEGRPTSEMLQMSNYIDWDFTNIWGINTSMNDGYPYLIYGESPIILELEPENEAPVAEAGINQVLEATSANETLVTLDGSGSFDPEGSLLSYNWSYTEGNTTGQNPTISLPLGTHIVTLEVSDGELTSTDTVEIKIVDTTKPNITGKTTIEANHNNWFSSEVTIHFEADDSVSGIKFVTDDITLDEEGENLSVEGTAEDNSGNISTCTVSDINIDMTAPIVDTNIPEEGAVFILNEVAYFEYSVMDNLSGISSESSDVDDGGLIDTSSPGKYSFKIYAIDNAGNETEKTIYYQVIYDFQGFFGPLKNDKNNTYVIGRTLPIKFIIKDSEGNVPDNVKTRLYIGKVEDSSVIEYKKATPINKTWLDNYFNYVNSDELDFYQYNLTTDNFVAGDYKIKIVLDDEKEYFIDVGFFKKGKSKK